MKIGEVLGNMYEVYASALTVYFKNGNTQTVIFIDDCCAYDPELTTGYCWVLDVDEDNNVFVANWTMYPEEMFDHDEIVVLYHKETTVAELYLYKTADEAMMEKREA